MHIALIGMSGTGKSYWSQCLGDAGFTRVGCDDLIGRRLAAALGLSDTSLEAIGRWMGFPHEAGFHQRQARYLDCERQVLQDILDRLEKPRLSAHGDLVVDTTGSVVYTGAAFQRRLRQVARVIYLTLNATQRRRAQEAYLARPRPVIWRDYYRRRPGETPDATLRRCYVALLRDRHERYANLAHQAVPVPDADCGPEARAAFLATIAPRCPHDS